MAETDLRRTGRNRARTDVVAPWAFDGGKVFVHREHGQVSTGESAFDDCGVNAAMVGCAETEIANLPEHIGRN